jgi:hypothetical protein
MDLGCVSLIYDNEGHRLLLRLMANDKHAATEIARRVPTKHEVIRIFFDVAGFGYDFVGAGAAYVLCPGVTPIPVGKHS